MIQVQESLLQQGINVILKRTEQKQGIGVVEVIKISDVMYRVDFGNMTEEQVPYENIEVTDKYIIRKFFHNTNSEELLWHRDRENRLIEHISGKNWRFQYDNELPIPIEPNHFIDIPSGCWHRIHCGSDDLIIKINFLES